MRSLLLLAVALASLTGCAHYDALAVGESLTIGDGRLAPALSVEVAEGSGSSSDRRTLFTEARARALVGPTRQQLAGLVGVSQLEWVGPRAPIWGALNLGPGLEHFSSTLFFEAVAQARLGTGFVLAEIVEPYSPLNPWGPEAEPWPMPNADLSTPRSTIRSRVLLTLALVGDIDVRFTRDPLYVTSLMLGISRIEELRGTR
ncbi:MAG: hypothetical protein BGO98_17120 [Myxococcales bacterium 68-20]|nr:hypothetical protein [Myxococcales bacterium]OJY23679.1 MAG: hypothetical protein BGO98_17120 [Myxococcales bacterium 68-20]